MKITILGWLLIIAAIIAVLLILDVSVENPSLAQLLSKIRNVINNNEPPDARKRTPGSDDLSGTMS